MSNYKSYYEPKKVVVNRFWKRPKPKVYECNIRDAERFYQESYKDYLKSKEFYASRPEPSHARSIEDEFASKWSQVRANRNRDSTIGDPLSRRAREGSLGAFGNDGSLEGYRSTLNAYGRLDDERGARSGNRANSMLNTRPESPDAEIQSIDDRLDRLKKLRDELGLPPEAENGIPQAPSESRSAMKSPPDSRGLGPDSSKYPPSRGDSRSKLADYDLQTKTEKSTRFARQFSGGDNRIPRENGAYSSAYSADNELDKYSVRNYMRSSERKPVHGGDSSDYSYKQSAESKSIRRFGGEDEPSSSYKYSTESKSSALKGASATDDDGFRPSESKWRSKYTSDELDSRSTRVKSSRTDRDDEVPDYDDEFLSNLKKKFPTSDEIIQKISKMDVE